MKAAMVFGDGCSDRCGSGFGQAQERNDLGARHSLPFFSGATILRRKPQRRERDCADERDIKRCARHRAMCGTASVTRQ
jgi:hypothetical protein